MEVKTKRTDTDCADLIIKDIGESCVRFELEKENEIKEELDNITEFLESEYKLTDKDIVLSKYIKDGKFNGITYHFKNSDSTIKGQLCIVFYTDKKQPCYIFTTAIDYPQTWSINQYNEFCKQIDKLAKDLKLKMSTYIEKSYVSIPLRRRSIYSEPVFYAKQKKIDIGSFKEFLGKIQIMAEKYPLCNK